MENFLEVKELSILLDRLGVIVNFELLFFIR